MTEMKKPPGGGQLACMIWLRVGLYCQHRVGLGDLFEEDLTYGKTPFWLIYKHYERL
ncbi:hypothetical protein BLA6863_00138 [Burkholderia lata]|uniref:Uncharacterized protein n=1 Tax=Burkholderia lata (strain ATCC 17760 / DSM 23089 / LMG 22485 / NCIMB 9086 / R18194 / 383) TaxID=482957 RepID=A0A6P2GU69_BURL3|nr:hypothetical protein BLA6863_00138 [Burkholderia lata]